MNQVIIPSEVAMPILEYFPKISGLYETFSFLFQVRILNLISNIHVVNRQYDNLFSIGRYGAGHSCRRRTK